MITVTNAVVLASTEGEGRTFTALLSLALSGNYGTAASHGDTLSFASVNNPLLPSSQPPLCCFIYEQQAAGTAPSFYQATYNPGTTRDNGSVGFSTGGVETPAAGAAYSGSAPILATSWYALVTFPLFM
jgi:hypothetical protein